MIDFKLTCFCKETLTVKVAEGEMECSLGEGFNIKTATLEKAEQRIIEAGWEFHGGMWCCPKCSKGNEVLNTYEITCACGEKFSTRASTLDDAEKLAIGAGWSIKDHGYSCPKCKGNEVNSFEIWIRARGWSLNKYENIYTDHRTAGAWLLWQRHEREFPERVKMAVEEEVKLITDFVHEKGHPATAELIEKGKHKKKKLTDKEKLKAVYTYVCGKHRNQCLPENPNPHNAEKAYEYVLKAIEEQMGS